MKIEDKAYFAADKNSEALKRALADTNYNISDVVKHNEEDVGTLAGSGNFTVKIGMGSYEHWFYKITPSGKYKKNSVRLSTYSKPVEDKRYFEFQDTNKEALKKKLASNMKKEIENLDKTIDKKAKELENTVWGDKWTGSPALAEKENKKFKQLLDLGNQLRFLNSLLLNNGMSHELVESSLKNSLLKMQKVKDFSMPVEDKAYFDKRIEVETWKSPKGTTLIAGLNQGSSGLFQPFITATYLDGGQQLMTMNPPKFKTEGGARKWLSAEITRRKTPNARQGSKAKFANRGAFAEASSSPVLGSLLEKKVMPEGGWRAVETDGAALVIAFEDGDIAGNFARRASENGYSATAPMAMAGRFWNVKVQNENVEVEKQLNFKKKNKFGFNTWTEKDTLTLREMANEVQDLRTNSYAKSIAWNELGFMCNKILDICDKAFAAKDSDMIQIIKSKIKQVKDQTKKTK
ncbi:MAG: hypothetical protein WCL34_14740 [Methylococcaceae bacterium]